MYTLYMYVCAYIMYMYVCDLSTCIMYYSVKFCFAFPAASAPVCYCCCCCCQQEHSPPPHEGPGPSLPRRFQVPPSLLAPAPDSPSLLAPTPDSPSLLAPAPDSPSLLAPTPDSPSLLASAPDSPNLLAPAPDSSPGEVLHASAHHCWWTGVWWGLGQGVRRVKKTQSGPHVWL